MTAELNTLMTALAAGTVSAILGLLLISRLGGLQPARRDLIDRTVEPMVFLFRDRTLIDATPPARTLMATLAGDSDWMRIAAFLAMRFPHAPDLLARAAEHGRAQAVAEMGPRAAALRVEVEDMGHNLTRVTLIDPGAENAGITVDSQSLAAMEDELEILRDTIDNTPVMIWREERDGTVSWANSTYLREALPDDETCWPIPRLLDLPPDDDGAMPRRVRMDSAHGVRWLDCHTRNHDGRRMICALPADATVRAESSLREFVQTLTKTFADLPIGLAIFDRQRQLQLFNPALIDLTGLATGFLTARPSLYAFLDRLREARMVPEPKDYRSWRHMMTNLEAAASQGHHVETWPLPGGQTYRVTGRPHPDGAIALLFEDITSETSLTRRFRSELSLNRELLDRMDEAIVVFDASLKLVSTNAGYGELWGRGTGGKLADHLAMWEAEIADPQDMAALNGALTMRPRPLASGGTVRLRDGILRKWRMRTLRNGRLAVSFCDIDAAADQPSAPAASPAHAGESLVAVG